MKKTYITPALATEAVEQCSPILAGSLKIEGESGQASFYEEDAQGEALAKEDWGDIWN